MSAHDIAKMFDDARGELSYTELGRDKWLEETNLIDVRFAESLAAEFPTPIAQLVFDRAWSDGHSSGYYEVAYKYEEFAELVQAAVTALSPSP